MRGDRLWTDQRALAELQVGSAAIRLDQETSVEILELNDRLVQLELSQGSLNLRVRRLYPGQDFEVATPTLAFVIDRPGSYRIDVDPRYGRTTIVVWEGAGVAYGDSGQFQVRAGDAVRFYGTDLRDYEMFGLPRMDHFDRYCLDRDRRLDRSMSLRYVGDDVIGYADLDDYGYWRSTPGYGNVWYPSQVGVELGALSRRSLDLAGAVGLDLGGRRALGLRAFALRALGLRFQSLGLDTGAAQLSPGLRAGAGGVHRRQRLEPVALARR